MATMELDPLFLKAINLLRSKNPDSAKQLNALVEEYREKTCGGAPAKKPSAEDNGNNNSNNNNNGSTSSSNNNNNSNKSVKVETIKQGSVKLSPSPTNIKEKKPSTSPVALIDNKLIEVPNLIDESSSESFKDTDATIEEITVGSSLEQPASKKQRLNSTKVTALETSPISDTEEKYNIPIDEIIEMDFDGPTCKICHLSKRAEEENLLAECAECHAHYHQLCHKPNVSTKDLNDPRLIWYCSRCTKKMSKEMAAQQQQQQKQQHSSNNNGKPNPDAAPKVVSNPFQQQSKQQPFRRNIPPTDSTKASDKSNKKTPVGPASLNSSSDSAVSTSSKESSSREGSPSRLKPRDVAVNSMKRLELVKKRANKMQQLMKQSRK